MDHEPPIYCNKYAIKKLDLNPKRSKSMPRHVQTRSENNFLEDVRIRPIASDDEFDYIRGKRVDRRREKPSNFYFFK